MERHFPLSWATFENLGVLRLNEAVDLAAKAGRVSSVMKVHILKATPQRPPEAATPLLTPVEVFAHWVALLSPRCDVSGKRQMLRSPQIAELQPSDSDSIFNLRSPVSTESEFFSIGGDSASSVEEAHEERGHG